MSRGNNWSDVLIADDIVGSGDDRRVSLTSLPDGREVSTVSLTVDHSHGVGPPLFYETMVRTKGEWNAAEEPLPFRYTTKEEAEEGHKVVVEALLKEIADG